MYTNVKFVVVDDDKLIRDFVTDVLMFSVNREVRSFSNGFSAWDFIEAPDNADIVVSDVDMPEMSGFELLAKIKENFPEKKCIIMSGDPGNESTAKRLGADGFLAKPFGMEDLFNIVDAFVVGSETSCN
ncbi:response regulator [Thermodesulfobacteriota bacterium]